ncbi:hypothetical protein AMJ80_09580 [bacterium SM23_31]|nr:MAG: hypothetical protein AMJ80_09580 [bacterium SM23_31]
MKSKYLFITLMVVIAVSLLGTASLFAQEKMKYEDYLIALQVEKDREEAAQVKIAALQSEIDALRARLAELDKQILQTQADFWRALDSSPEGYARFIDALNQLRAQIQGLLNLESGELYKRGDEVARVEMRFEQLAGQKVAKHPDAVPIVNDIRNLLNRLKNALANAKPPFEVYTVVNGDYLWRIARKPEVYNDPFQWIRIYTKNRDMITNPDLIFPGQDFKIFHDVLENEHLVVRGEFLSKIAGYPHVYNDPFMWTRLYELNEDVIMDKDLIYPHMILFIR